MARVGGADLEVAEHRVRGASCTLAVVSAKPGDEDVEERVEHYLAVLSHCIDQCAANQSGNVDVFLWNARRVVEAILYSLAAGTPAEAVTKKDEPNLHALASELVKLNRLTATVSLELEHIRRLGNIGTHIQHPSRAASADELDSCRRNLVRPCRWLYSESKLARAMPDLVTTALADLDSAKVRMKEGERTAKLQLRLDEDEAAIVALKEKLRIVTATNESLRRSAPPAASARWIFGVLGICLGMVFGVVGARWLQPSVRDDSNDILVEPDGELPAAEVADASVAFDASMDDEDAAAVVPSAAAIVLTCPDNYELVPEGTLALTTGPFPRPDWPRPDMPLHEVLVPAFCIARQPVTTAEHAACVSAHQCAPIAGCNFADARHGGLAANCTRELDAEAYCVAHGARVPSVAEWERSAAAVSDDIHFLPRTEEWASDRFPPAVFGYSSGVSTSGAHVYHAGPVNPPVPGSPVLSWRRRADDADRQTSLSYRCVVDPVRETPTTAL